MIKQTGLVETHPSVRPYLPGSVDCPRSFFTQDDLQGVGGFVSNQPEDFIVHELPKYLPSGEGEHCMVKILKVERTTEEAVQALADGSGVLVQEIGYAGRKDKYAITSQWLTLPCASQHVRSVDEQVVVLDAQAHKQKMRLGQNQGNFFTIRISEIADPQNVQSSLDRVAKGLPNYFAEQRFGRAWYERRPAEDYQPPRAEDGTLLQDPNNLARDNVDRAFMFLARFAKNNKRPNTKQKRDVKLALSALQSALFNLWIGERIKDQIIDQVIEGDVCRKIEGGTFYSTDPQLDTERLRRGEIMVLGPLLGPKLFPAQAVALEREEALYQAWGIDAELREGLGKFWRGDRRPLLLKPYKLNAELETHSQGHNLRVNFSLPTGSFATAIIAALIDPNLERFERSLIAE